MDFPVKVKNLNPVLFKQISIEKDVAGVGFQFAIPENTSICKKTVDDKSRSDIILFQLESGDMKLNLSRHHLLREMSASYWHQWELSRQKRIVVNSREIITSAGRISDVLSKKTVEGKTFVFRSTIFKTAGLVYFLDIGAPLNSYSKRADEILSILSSFQLLSPSSQMFAEAMDAFRFGDRGPSFNFPTSWSVDSASNGNDLILRNEYKSERLGSIYVSVHDLSSDPLKIHMKAVHLERLEILEENFQLIERESRFEKSYAGQPKANRDGEEIYVAMLSVIISGRQASFTTVSIPQAASLIWWAVNYRAFEIIRDTFKIE